MRTPLPRRARVAAISRSSGQPFDIRVTTDHADAVVALTGELDVVSADVLEREVRALRLAGFHRVVVDLRHVEFLDSTALQVLLRLHDRAQREGHELILVRGPGQTQRIFELTGTDMVFDWRD